MKIVICIAGKKGREQCAHVLRLLGQECGLTTGLIVYEKHSQLLFDMEERKSHPDMIYLGVGRTAPTGIETAYTLRRMGYRGELVLLAFSEEFAVQGYGVEAFAYLIAGKATYSCFQETFQKGIKKVFHREEQEVLTLMIHGSLFRIFTREILYIEMLNRIIYIHYAGGEPIICRMQIGKLEQQLKDSGFLRVHQSFIVNIHYVHYISGQNIVLVNQKNIPIGRNYRNQISRLLIAYDVKKNRKEREHLEQEEQRRNRYQIYLLLGRLLDEVLNVTGRTVTKCGN